MRALRYISRIAVVACGSRPGGVHLHSNLATCSFAAYRSKYPAASRKPLAYPHQNLYGNINVNNFRYDVTANRFINSDSSGVSKQKETTGHPHKHKKPTKIQGKHKTAKQDVKSKTSEETGKETVSQTSAETSSGEQTNQSGTSKQIEQDGQSGQTLQTEEAGTQDTPESENLSIFQRFKRAYKEHGKILIGVHLVTSTVWFGSFFYAAKMGVDIVPLLEQWGFSETVIKPFKSSELGHIALAYLMYKLATPARYTVTLGGTNLAIRYFRKTGKMAPKQEGDSLREMYKDSKDRLQERRHHVTSQLRKKRLKALEEARWKRKKK